MSLDRTELLANKALQLPSAAVLPRWVVPLRAARSASIERRQRREPRLEGVTIGRSWGWRSQLRAGPLGSLALHLH